MDLSHQSKYVSSQEKSHKTPGQLIPSKNGESSSRNSGTSCSNADSGVASQEEDDIESSSNCLLYTSPSPRDRG